MSDIRRSIEALEYPAKDIGKILIDFYDTMKRLEFDANRGGIQATKIVMTINDIEKLIEQLLLENERIKENPGCDIY